MDLNNNRFKIIWNKDRTLALIVDSSQAEYEQLNVNSQNKDTTIDSKAPYVIAELQYSAAEALFMNFIEQQFWSPSAIDAIMGATYGDAIKDVKRLLEGEPKESDPLENVGLVAENPEDDTGSPPDEVQSVGEKTKTPLEADDGTVNFEKFKGSINIIASGEGKVIIGDTGIKTIIDNVDNK